MQHLATIIALLLLAPIAIATTSTPERNVAFFWSLLGDEEPEQAATLSDGRTMTLSAAVADAAARAGSVDLGAMASGAAPGGLPPAGDVWVIEVGAGPCTAQVLAPGNPYWHHWGPQLWVHQGDIGTLATMQGDSTAMIGWTTKTFQYATNTAGFTAVGNQDFYCFLFGESHLAFPYLDGTAIMN